MLRQNKKGFTLVEILVVIGVLTVLATIGILVFKPLEYNRQSRDTRRVGDLNAIQSALDMSIANNPNMSLGSSTATVYVSIPDPTLVGNAISTCGGVAGLAALPSGWQYQCVSAANSTKIDGTGWMPVNFSTLPNGSPIVSLPLDPINSVTNRSYYTYIPQGGMTAKLESTKVIASAGAKDGGVDDTLYEMGKTPNPIAILSAPTITSLSSTNIGSRTATILGAGNPNGAITTGSVRYSTTNPGTCNDTFGSNAGGVWVYNGASSPFSFSIVFSSLTPLQTYYFCAIAQNSVGQVVSPVQSFTTIQNAWKQLAPSGTLPGVRSGHSMLFTFSDFNVYVFGGQNGATSYLNDLWKYNPAGDKWTQPGLIGSPPPARSEHTAVWGSTGKKMYVFGGQNGATSYLNDLWVYDMDASGWTQLTPSGTPPVARAGHTAIWDSTRGKMYMFGGQNGATSYLNDLWSYDPVANSWTQLAPSGTPPVARTEHIAVWDNGRNKMYVAAGGYQSCSGSCTLITLTDIWSYDPVANSWTKLVPAGVPSIGMGDSVIWDNIKSKMYVIDGSALWSYDPVANSWTQLAPSGTPPSAGTERAATWDNSSIMYLFGGVNGSSYSNTLQAYIP